MSNTMIARRARVALVLLVLASASFYAGSQIVTAPQRTPPKHPVTGRQIAGIATDRGWLDRSEREQEEDPDRAVDLLEITPGMSVADVGAGTGYMTFRIARKVGPDGKVFANDLQPAMLSTIERKARDQSIQNVALVQGTDTDTRLPAASVDVAVLVDVYHEFWHPQEMLRSIHRSLKPSGRLVLIEYRKEDPTIPIAFTHRLSVTEARTEVEPEGFEFDKSIEALPRQHIIVFKALRRSGDASR